MPTAERNYWPGQATRSQRKAARADILLENVGVTPATRERYLTAVHRMSHLLPMVTSEASFDDLVADWIQAEFEDGTPLYLVGDALSGIHHFEPYTKKKLPKSWRLYSIWRRYEVPCRAPPLTQDITLAMAGWCVSNGQLVMAALLLLGFHALLRTGELLAVRPCDFLLDSRKGLVSLPQSKSGLRNNSPESVSLHDPVTLEAVRAMVLHQSSLGLQQVPCWQKSGSAFRSLFARITQELQVDHLSFRPYSLRRGGATWEMQSHGLMERTLIRGRWKNSNIARIYINDGLSLLPRLTLSWDAKKLIRDFSSVFQTYEQCSTGQRGKKRQKQK